jgi:hypothetical protein
MDKQMSAIAAKMQASAGTLVKQAYAGGGLDGPRSLSVVTLRAGDDEEVSATAIGNTEAAGYPAQRNHGPCTTATKSCLIMTPGLPSVSIETFPAGTTFRGISRTVPSGQTGVAITLTE